MAVGIAKLGGVLKLSVFQDPAEAPIPLPMPINLLEAVGFDIELKKNVRYRGVALAERPAKDYKNEEVAQRAQVYFHRGV